MEKKKTRDLIAGTLTILLLSAAFCGHSAAGEKMHIDLEGAINLALSQNRAIEITKMKMAETRYKLAEMQSHYFPRLSAGGTYGYNTNPAEISIKKGEYTHLETSLLPREMTGSINLTSPSPSHCHRSLRSDPVWI